MQADSTFTIALALTAKVSY